MRTTTQESIENLGKYPFTRAAEEYVDQLHLTLPEITKPDFEEALIRAEERIADAITKASTTGKDDLTELLSFPIANMFVIGIGETYVDQRYTLSESAREAQASCEASILAI